MRSVECLMWLQVALIVDSDQFRQVNKKKTSCLGSSMIRTILTRKYINFSRCLDGHECLEITEIAAGGFNAVVCPGL